MAGVVVGSAAGRGLRMAVACGAQNSRALVGAASRSCRCCELAFRLWPGVAAGGHAGASNSGGVSRNAAAAAPLLFSAHVDLTYYRRDVDRLARSTLVAARSEEH